MSLSSSSRQRVAAAAAALALFLGGCASSTRLEPAAPVEDRGAGASGSAAAAARPGSGNNTGATSQSGVATLELGKNADIGTGNAGLSRVVYFDLNSFVVSDAYRRVIEANAKYLTSDRKRSMLVEGHTDERGGREYNLALGQKRAEAVVRSLELLGVRDSQTEAVSYGKERPAVIGNDEAAWAKNRRAELKDR